MGVLGGSLSEGIDFKNNLLHSVVVVGLPLSPPSIENQALKDYYSDKFGPKKGSPGCREMHQERDRQGDNLPHGLQIFPGTLL
jgi:hypothetical protein